jgi:excisionase family DNA binding protein
MGKNRTKPVEPLTGVGGNAGVNEETASRTASQQTVRLLKAKEVADKLGVGRSKAYEMIGRRELPVVRIGTAVRVPSNKLDLWIAAHTEEAA